MFAGNLDKNVFQGDLVDVDNALNVVIISIVIFTIRNFVFMVALRTILDPFLTVNDDNPNNP